MPPRICGLSRRGRGGRPSSAPAHNRRVWPLENFSQRACFHLNANRAIETHTHMICLRGSQHTESAASSANRVVRSCRVGQSCGDGGSDRARAQRRVAEAALRLGPDLVCTGLGIGRLGPGAPNVGSLIEQAVREAARRRISYLESIGVISRLGTDGVVHEQAKMSKKEVLLRAASAVILAHRTSEVATLNGMAQAERYRPGQLRGRGCGRWPDNHLRGRPRRVYNSAGCTTKFFGYAVSAKQSLRAA